LSLAKDNRPQAEEVISSLFGIAYIAVEAQKIGRGFFRGFMA
jgi:hypothetical protein